MQVLVAIGAVTVALVAYTIGTVLELRARAITRAVFGAFLVGLLGDLTGTLLMVFLSTGFSFDPHSVAGVVALTLMAGKTIWIASFLRSGSGGIPPRAFSVLVWALWATVYATGFVLHG